MRILVRIFFQLNPAPDSSVAPLGVSGAAAAAPAAFSSFERRRQAMALRRGSCCVYDVQIQARLF